MNHSDHFCSHHANGYNPRIQFIRYGIQEAHGKPKHRTYKNQEASLPLSDANLLPVIFPTLFQQFKDS
jgi:hypothetical protein